MGGTATKTLAQFWDSDSWSILRERNVHAFRLNVHSGLGHSCSVQCPAVEKMSDPSWLQPTPCKELEPNWLTPTAGQDLGQAKVSCSQATPRKTQVAVAASAASAAATAAQAAAVLLQDTPQKRNKPPSVASAQKTSMAESREASGAGKAKHMAEEPTAEEHIAQEQKASVQRPKPPTSTRAYAARGSKGTFGGRRPPKNPALLEGFQKARAEYLAQKEADQTQQKKPKRRYTPEQEKYQAWQRTFDRSSASSSRARFIEAAAAWQVEQARQVAEKASLH